MIDVYSFSKDKVSKGSLKDVADQSKICLVDVNKPTKADYENIARITGISETEIKEHLEENLRPRVEDFEENSLIIFRYPIKTEAAFETHPLTIIVSKKRNYVVVIKIKECKPLEEMIAKNNLEKIFKHGVGDLVYRILDKMVSEYFRILDWVEDESDKIESAVVKKPDHMYISKIFSLKKTLLFFHKALSANREVIVSIEKEYISNLDKKTIRRFRDIYQDIVQLIDMEETYRDILTGTLDVYLSSVSNNLNKTMKTLTVISAFIMAPTLIASTYGMNFNPQASPYNMPELNWVLGYPFALGMMLISVCILFFYFKHKKWL